MLDLLHLSDRLRAAGRDDAWHVFAGYAADLGFDRIIRYDLDGPEPQVRSTFNADWLIHYQDRRFALHDPFFVHCCRPGRAVATGVAYLADYDYLSADQKQVIRDAGDAGFNAGFSAVLPDQPTCAWNIGSSLPRRDVEALSRELARTLPLALRMVGIYLRRTPDLTDRETSVLHLLAAGLRTQEIAHELGLAIVTVDLHMRNARIKLGARTRDQALLKFALAGLSTRD